jgi:hypothetical protein
MTIKQRKPRIPVVANASVNALKDVVKNGDGSPEVVNGATAKLPGLTPVKKRGLPTSKANPIPETRDPALRNCDGVDKPTAVVYTADEIPVTKAKTRLGTMRLKFRSALFRDRDRVRIRLRDEYSNPQPYRIKLQ